MKFADIFFDENDTPKSSRYLDVYFSQGEGIKETEHVFIEPNRLPQRFSALKKHDHFTVAETGFGTGLNFLVTWREFLRHAPKDARLTFISCEKYPISPEDLAAAHNRLPELAKLSADLRHAYPPALSGYHLLEFGQVNLLLILDDATTAYEQLSAKVDAWFLDGFTPSRNPDIWQPELFAQISRLSHQGTTFSTFTSARPVRDNLLGAGFKLSKIRGFGKKRDMLLGHFVGVCGPQYITGWPSSELPTPKQVPGKRVAIIGAGIAGVTTAVELRKRGFTVELFEKEPAAARGGSGNRQGAVYAKLSATPTVATQFYAQALLTAQRLLSDLPKEVAHAQCGLAQLVHDARELKRLHELSTSGYIPDTLACAKTAQELSQLLGVHVKDDGLWFKQGGWLAPAELIYYLIEQHKLVCHFNTHIKNLEQTDSGWELTSATAQHWQFDHVILCNAFEAASIQQTKHLPLNTIAGQVTQLALQPTHKKLKAVICTDRYVMPASQNQLTIGSTFRVKSTNTEVTAEDHQENINNLTQRVPGLLNDQEQVVTGRAAVRCNTPDYLPFVGAVSPHQALADQFRIPLQRNRAHKEQPATHLAGLWVNLAHGSKGLCSSHLSAKLLAAMIAGEPLPVPAQVIQALNPNRFVIRSVLREKRVKRSP